jgi:pyruvate/2-oxoglutarate dehydrogenase complex dihydrolipoamide acyltransferase (E2) component
MRSNVKMPKLGETVDEVLVLEWAVSVGDVVSAGDSLMTVETDKVEAELPSPVAGTVVELLVEIDDEVSVGTPVCTIEI